jgi:uncharacterized integral membrane protein
MFPGSNRRAAGISRKGAVMQYMLIGIVLLVSIAVVFALQNAGPVTVTFLAWRFAMSLALLLLVTFVCGIVVSLLAAIPSQRRKNRLIAEQRQVIKAMNDTAIDGQLPGQPMNPVN